jgi:PAS domain S-box-containing protein
MTYHTDATAMRRQWIEWLFLLLGLLIVAAALAYAHLAEASRHDAAERERLSVLTTLLAKNIEVDLAATSLVLDGVIRDYLAAGIAPDAGQALPRRLSALVDAMPGVRTMLVIDASGRPVATNIPELLGQDFSRRSYFQTARDAPDARMLYISAPFQSFKRDLVITAARMVQDRQGRFAGVVVATFDPEYFTAKFRTAMYAADVWAVLVHGEGRQFLNYPPKSANGGNVDLSGSFLRRFRDSGYQAGVLSGVGIAGAAAAPRVMAMATIAPAALHMDHPLYIGLSREEAAIAAPLRRQALGYFLSFATLALAGASLLFWSQRRRRQQAVWRAEHESERQAMQAVSDSETRFRTLIEDAPVAIAILRHGRIIYSNPRYRHLHGYAVGDDLSGLPWRAMLTAASQVALASQEALIEADSASEQMFEAVGLDKQGQPVPVFKTTARVLLKDGPATLIFAQDISAQKQAEAAMLLARDGAEAANRSKAEFLANMSHEIRSPLNAILGMAWLLERGSLDEEGLLMTRKIRAAGQSLLGIINDVLDVSKIEAGHMSIEQAPFRLADVIEKIAASMGVAAHDKPIAVRIGPLPDGVDHVLGDALRLEQVLVNLGSNAIKFTAQGTVELLTTLESRDGDTVVLRFCVRDTGIGIAAEVQEAIFSAFAQADSSTTRRFGGTGLGLTICRQLVRLMGGALQLKSAPGQGSDFSFTVPLQLMPAGALSSPDMQGLHVLLADDDADAREAVAAVARGLSWSVHAVSGGQAALDYALACAEDARPGVVVLAAHMPKLDAEATARALREYLPPQACPVVILAASGAPEKTPARRRTDPVNAADAMLNEPVTASSLYNATMEARQGRRPGHQSCPPRRAPAGRRARAGGRRQRDQPRCGQAYPVRPGRRAIVRLRWQAGAGLAAGPPGRRRHRADGCADARHGWLAGDARAAPAAAVPRLARGGADSRRVPDAARGGAGSGREPFHQQTVRRAADHRPDRARTPPPCARAAGRGRHGAARAVLGRRARDRPGARHGPVARRSALPPAPVALWQHLQQHGGRHARAAGGRCAQRRGGAGAPTGGRGRQPGPACHPACSAACRTAAARGRRCGRRPRHAGTGAGARHRSRRRSHGAGAAWPAGHANDKLTNMNIQEMP